jgi:SAM-dependent methyltransferase
MIRTTVSHLRLVDRVEFVLKLCKNQRVLHLGATDAPETEAAIQHHRFLHFQLATVASHLVGMDNNQDAIELLAVKHGVTNIHYGDIEVADDYPKGKFDVVIAGEIFEHLSNPGRALDALKKNLSPGTTLVVSVPNAYSLKGFCRAFAGHEWIHPDHTLHHSPRTLYALLSRHGFSIDSTFSVINGGTGLLARSANWFLKLTPQLAEGIGVVCKPTKETSGSGLPR